MDTHEVPEVLNPAGSVCYPLFIPDDPHWRQLVLGALSQLTNPDYYRQNAFAPNDVISVCETWHEQMLVPFVQSMNDNAGCATMATYHEAERTTTQSITANTQTPIIWTTGGTPPLFSFVSIPASGIATVSFRVKLQSAVGAVKTAFLIHNGVEVTRHDIRVNTANQWLNLSYVMEVEVGDTFRVDVLCPQAMTVQVDDFTPKLSMVIV